jgi:hypothetical protein
MTREERLAYFREYNKNRPKTRRPNHEERIAINREKRQANPEYWRKVSNDAYHRNKDKNMPCYSKENKIWWAARKRATAKELPFDLERSDVVITDTCPCCGDPMVRPSLDQVRPAEGYTKNNVAVICFDCNVIKSYGTAERHRRIADWMDSFNESREAESPD